MGQLAEKVRAKFPGLYDDLDDATLEKNVLAKHPEYADLAKPESAKPPEKGWIESAVDFVKAHPTEIGAMAGGIAAVPLTGGASLLPAVAAAGLGGAGGAGLGMLAGAAGGSPNLPSTAGGVIRTMGVQGATQAGAELGGRAISAGLKAGAGRLYQSVLKPTVAARREFPNLVQTGLENAVPVSKGGVDKAGELVGASKAAADQLVADAAAQPGAAVIDPKQAVSGITSAVKGVKDLPVARPQMKAIGDYGRQYLAEHPRPLSLTEAQQAVRATDRFFDPAYRATMDRGNAITSGHTAAALGINGETRNMLRTAVPGLKAQNANTSALAGLKEAIERRAGEQGNRSAIGMQHLINAGIGAGAGELGGREKGIGTFLAMEALTNPAAASQVAFGAAQASRVPTQQAIRAALLALMSGDEQKVGGEQK